VLKGLGEWESGRTGEQENRRTGEQENRRSVRVRIQVLNRIQVGLPRPANIFHPCPIRLFPDHIGIGRNGTG
jgi:hypothetical protein